MAGDFERSAGRNQARPLGRCGRRCRFAMIGRLPIRGADTPADYERAFELVRRYDNWPVYDMVYVALAERLRTEFYTADDRLRARLAHLPWVRGINDG